MQKIFYEKEIDLLHQLKELVSLTVDESIDYKIEDHGVRAVGSLAIKGEYISQEKRHFLENVELDVYADDQKITDHQDFHLKVEDFHYDIIDGNLKIKIEVGVYGVEEGENRYIQLDEDPIDEIEKLSRDVEATTVEKEVIEPEIPEEIQDVEKLQEKIYETKEKEDSNGGTDYSPVGTCVIFCGISSVSDKEDRGDRKPVLSGRRTGKMGSKRQVCIQLHLYLVEV